MNTGSLLQTKYYLSNSSSKTAIIRRHHPLYDQQLELLSVGKTTVVVRLPDGSSMKIPRHWIDVDGSTCAELVGESEISLQGLKELLRLFIVLRERIGNDSEMIAAVQSNAEGGDDETKMFGISRSRVSRSVVGDVPEHARDEVTRQLARLMARASVARIRALRADSKKQEVRDESNDG